MFVASCPRSLWLGPLLYKPFFFQPYFNSWNPHPILIFIWVKCYLIKRSSALQYIYIVVHCKYSTNSLGTTSTAFTFFSATKSCEATIFWVLFLFFYWHGVFFSKFQYNIWQSCSVTKESVLYSLFSWFKFGKWNRASDSEMVGVLKYFVIHLI